MSDSSNNAIRKYEWLISIMNEPGSVNGNSQNERPIVPKLSNSEYDWNVVGIGPYSKEHWCELNGLKTTMVRQFVQDSGVSIEVLYNNVAEVVMASSAIKYYDEAQLPSMLLRSILVKEEYKSKGTILRVYRSEIKKEELVDILFLDGCFVLHFIFSDLRKPENLKMLSTADAAGITRDLLLFQSQLPYQVIQSLMSFRFKEGEGEELINDFIDNVRALPPRQATFMEAMKKCFSNHIWLPRAQSQLGKQKNRGDQPAHILQLLHRNLIGKQHDVTIDQPRGRSRIWYANRSAKDLRKLGIHFRPSRTDVVTDVKFKSTALGGFLKLPRITIDSLSESFLFNLMVYEKDCDTSKKLLVTSYLHLLDSLIQDSEDVNILQSAGILINNLGRHQEVADLFNKMRKFFYSSPYAYNDVKWQIELHCRHGKRWIGEWLQAHCSNPWTFLAFVAATLALILTGIQTYLAAFPPKK